MALPAPRRTVKKAPPHFHVDWEPADASALQALMRGDASKEQQARALDWIIQKLCMSYTVSFQPDNPHATSFIEGRRFSGLKIVELLAVSTRDLAAKAANLQG